ncbi:MAG: CARDB domain-containing protein [Candidatus Thermoplasmatota archaeon]
MDVRRTMRCLVILVVVIILFSPVVENSAGMRSEKTMQGPPGDGFGRTLTNVTITNLTFSKDEPKEGDNITIYVTVMNNRTNRIGKLNISLKISDQNFTERQVSINKTSTKTFSFHWIAEGGNQIVSAKLSKEMPDVGIVESKPVAKEIWVEPEPMGDVYSPLLALGFIFVVVFGSVLIPSGIASLTNRSSTRKEE